MILVLPVRIVRPPDSGHARLVLRTPDLKRGLTLFVPLEQSRLLLSEMHGLASDHCTHHHLTAALVTALDGKIVSVLLREVEKGWIRVAVRICTEWGSTDVEVDIVAALAMAVHLGIPIFAEHEQLLSDSENAPHFTATTPRDTPTPAPLAFREALDGLDLSFLIERQEDPNA